MFFHRSVPTRCALVLVLVIALGACTNGQTADSGLADVVDISVDARSDAATDTFGLDAADSDGSTEGDSSSADATTIDGSFDASSDATDTDVASPSDAIASDAGADGGAVEACMAACDHVFTCTGLTCTALGQDCAGAPPDPCVSDCIAATPCSSLSATTPSDCDAMCRGDAAVADTGSSDAASSSDAGSRAMCQSCTTMSCGAAGGACLTNTTCNAWLMCVSACADSACLDGCDAMFASAASLYRPLYACQCTNCAGPCGYANPCSR